jgi:hypothetical protein
MKTYRIKYIIKLLLIVFSITLISCEKENNKKLCDLIELPIEFDYNTNDEGELSIDLDQDCVDDIILFSSWNHNLGCGMNDFSASIGSLRSEVKIAAYEKNDSIFYLEYIQFIEDTTLWVDGIYDTVYRHEDGTLVDFNYDYYLKNVFKNRYPLQFDNKELINTDYSMWLCDTLVLSSSYTSFCHYPYNDQYGAWEDNFKFGPWDFDDNEKKYIAVSILGGHEIAYFAFEISVLFSSKIIVYQIIKI